LEELEYKREEGFFRVERAGVRDPESLWSIKRMKPL
jgi:hypothetical protein